ncbi:MAG TPA: iron-containing redox enzyme family protein [Frankiaceae bacterium]|nr:iron-containing redox enzyme family protein [Frankiaceae bacterium]
MPVPPLTARLAQIRSGERAPDTLAGVGPADRRDRFLALLDVYDLSLAPLYTVGDAARLAGHPAVVALKAGLERDWLAELSAGPPPADLPAGAAAAMRAVATRDRLPAVYRWLAREASWPQVVRFLAVEGGPDGGFDDLVALCQVGLSGTAKLELGHNYWDEMGDGAPDAVHTTLYERMVEAVGMPRIPRAELPVEALERCALGGLLATNRWLQPEMVGALGMVELQAGPRCRLVLRAFERLGAPPGAYPFYQVHAEVDPRHGRDWLELAVGPLAAAHPGWGPRMVRGAWWRSRAGDALFARLHRDLARGAMAAA